MRWFWLSSCLCLRMCEKIFNVPVLATYTSVTEVTSWLLLCTCDAFLHSHMVFTSNLGIRHEAKYSIIFYSATTKI